MGTPALDFTPIRFSTGDLPECERISAWRDFFGPKVFGGEIDPLPGEPFHADITLRLLPGLSFVSAINSPAQFSRTAALLADGRDGYGLHVNSVGCRVSQRGRDLECGPGDATLVSVAEAATTRVPGTSHYICLNISRTALAPLVPDLDDAVLRPIAQASDALRYLLGYLRFLEHEDMTGNNSLAPAAAVHLRDLLALVLGTTRDGAAVAEGGLRAARLVAIKRFIEGKPGDRTLNVNTVAAHHGLSPRTVQRMFEEDGTTFSDYVLDCRLKAAYRMLNDARYAHWSVSAIALEAGFGDLSYFNHRFRRRFGAPPSWLRSYGA